MACETLAKAGRLAAAVIERLGLPRPIYRQTTNYGHFGRPVLLWEE